MSATLLPARATRTVKRQRIFTGTSSWVCPDGVTSVLALLVSGGGAGFFQSGAAYPYGGAGGGVAVRTLPVVPGTSYPIMVGAGGGNSASGVTGVSGGNTSALGVTLGGGQGAGPTALTVPGSFGSGFGSGAQGVTTAWGRFGDGGRQGGNPDPGNGYSSASVNVGNGGNGGYPPYPAANSGNGGNTPNNSSFSQSSPGATGIVIIEWEEPA